jgi:hypothetical protein
MGISGIVTVGIQSGMLISVDVTTVGIGTSLRRRAHGLVRATSNVLPVIGHVSGALLGVAGHSPCRLGRRRTRRTCLRYVAEHRVASTQLGSLGCVPVHVSLQEVPSNESARTVREFTVVDLF